MLVVVERTCEYAIDPLGIDVPQPRFGWVLASEQRGQMQSAYQVLIASSAEKLQADTGDKWDSGKVDSDESVHVPYGGAALSSGEACWWKVRVWDADGAVSRYSEPATFEMGLLQRSDWEGEWIGADASISAPLLRKEFTIAKELTRARVYISGLGWHELYLNGEKVGDHVLDPATTDYAKQVLYVTHDVTDLLREGANAVGGMLGNGWFSEPEWEAYGDSPRLLVQMTLEYADGDTESLATDGTWKVASGPIVRNDLFGGETYDARLEKPGWAGPGYDDGEWRLALLKAPPGGRMVSQLMPAIKVNQTLKPVKLTNPQPGVFLYDFGQLFGGWARLRVAGERGTQVTIKYSARVFEDSGLIDKRRHEKGNETDTYVLKGDPEGEIYEPRFTYHPVQYVQVEGYPGEPALDSLEGRVVHSAVDLTGDFECSNPLLNQIHRNVVWTFTNGLFGIPLDCLHREHWAWTDPATITGSLYARKHMPLFWTKWLADIVDAQLEDGDIPDVAPAYPTIAVMYPGFKNYPGDPAWGGSYPPLVWFLYQYFGDRRVLEDHYLPMRQWVDHLTSTAEGHLATQGRLGDHMLPGDAPGQEEFASSETPPPVVWTGYYHRDAAILSQAACVLGESADAEKYALLAERIKEAFNDKWFDAATGTYSTASQTANAFPLALGIVPEEHVGHVLENLVSDVIEKRNGHLRTGNTGTTCLIDVLAGYGYGEVLYRIATQTTYPGWGYMVAQGATTIWESWSLVSTVGDSESMIMWATIDEFLYNDLAGIKGPEFYGPRMASPGFREVHIQPYLLGDLQHARASIRTVRGIVSSSWRWTAGGVKLDVTIPANSLAKVSVPKVGPGGATVTEGGGIVWENGRLVRGVAGISGGSESDEYVTFEVGSGSYSFESRDAGEPNGE